MSDPINDPLHQIAPLESKHDSVPFSLPWLTVLSGPFAALGLLSEPLLPYFYLFMISSMVGLGHKVYQWLRIRIQLRFPMTAQFDEGNPAYEWIDLFVKENVWRRSREFVVSATSSRRQWSVKTWTDLTVKGHAEYVPIYPVPQLFRWAGYWLEIERTTTPVGQFRGPSSIYITIYTLDMNVLFKLVEEARARYIKFNRTNTVIHLADSPPYDPHMTWTGVKEKLRRPLSSIILPEGLLDGLVQDAREFLTAEDWYVEAGIPHRRGYLLYGPPGTGKTSTIHALAGELEVEIYSLSLASHFVDNAFLERAAASVPKKAIFLIEDIDCALGTRDDEDYHTPNKNAPLGGLRFGGIAGMGNGEPMRSLVTLSGLLNTNYIDLLDPALLRPGRIDRKVQFQLATTEQTHAHFLRFFPPARFPQYAAATSTESTEGEETIPALDTLADAFAAAVPAGEFSTAELQGYLQGHKKAPEGAVEGAHAWVEAIRAERRGREERKAARHRREQGGVGHPTG
ncbi:hypothetical protein C8R46DRAFT_1226157 [Mycena filopes]|nr:hypothetical protein C8R46DRAFT_1226157 [Mycena filopes]